MNLIRVFLLLVVLLVLTLCSFKVWSIEQTKRSIKEDQIELSKIKYGIFSVDKWKQIISSILAKKVEEINFNPDQKTELRIKISKFLTNTIEDFESRYYEEKSQSIGGIVQGLIVGVTGMFDQIKNDIPVFTDQIVEFLSEKNNREKVKAFIMDKLSEYADRTFSRIDYTEHNRILSKYQKGDRKKTIIALEGEIDKLNKAETTFFMIGLLVLSICILMLVITSQPTKTEFVLQTLICMILLSTGLILPMIEIDARIESMSFSLLGEEVTFQDQVLYYKNKSILEVVSLMLTQNKLNVYFVGLLVVTFSVLFPITKLIASIAYVFNSNLRRNSIARFFVFRTGKWSMADVMVVAIFMSYIGFSGILTEQLEQLEGLSQKIEILTTNKSALQVGFFSFTSFALLSLLVSHKIQYKNATHNINQNE